MSDINPQKTFTLLQREVQEYRNPILITPIVISGILLLLMLLSIFLSGRIALVGDSQVNRLIQEHRNGDTGFGERTNAPADDSVRADNNSGQNWDFNRGRNPHKQIPDALANNLQPKSASLNSALDAVNSLFLLALLVISLQYLISCLHRDRQDRSVLFWKSMPVSDWEEILSKFAVACLVAPAIYLAVSIISQIAYALLSMLLVWRLDLNPSTVILNHIDGVSLLVGQLGRMLTWILWTAPLYAWVLLCSAAARRSPFMLAVCVPIGLVLIESVFFGSRYVSQAIFHHIPFGGSGSRGPYQASPDWAKLDYVGMLMGLVFTVVMLAIARWFRRHRFDA